MGLQVRTDLALEAKETVQKPDEEIRGVRVEEEKDAENEIYVTRVMIETKNGAKIMGKPMGTYITLEAPNMVTPDEDYHREISEKVAGQIKELLPDEKEELSVLVVGLGNRDVTADALGPNVADQLHITRHVVREFGKAAYNRNKMHMISALVPGVMAKTGMETCEIIRGVVEQTEPDVIIAIDALAARSTKRLNPDDPDHGHRRTARFGRGESPSCTDGGIYGNPGDRNRHSDSRGCGDYRGRCGGAGGTGDAVLLRYSFIEDGGTAEYVCDDKRYRRCGEQIKLYDIGGNQYCIGNIERAERR